MTKKRDHGDGAIDARGDDRYRLRYRVDGRRHTVTFHGTLSEARQIAADGDFSAAILDVNLDGQEIYPVADILAKRGLPFVFVTGYGERSLPEPYRGRPALQKPFQAEQLKTTLAGLLS